MRPSTSHTTSTTLPTTTAERTKGAMQSGKRMDGEKDDQALQCVLSDSDPGASSLRGTSRGRLIFSGRRVPHGAGHIHRSGLPGWNSEDIGYRCFHPSPLVLLRLI